MKEAFKAAAEAIRGAERLALACHVGPDGDALGSMLALGLAATKAGKEVVASFGTPFDVSSPLSFLPGLDLLVPPEQFPERPEVMVVFDAGAADRLGELGSNAGDAGTLIVVDHHVSTEPFGDIAVVDSTAASTGELVHALLEELGWPIDADVAECLLTAIITDTGRFQYQATKPKTLRTAAELMEAGASPSRITQNVYEKTPFGYLKAAGVALERATLHPDEGVVATVITEEDLDRVGIDWGDTDNLIDLVRLAEEADVAVLAKSHRDGRVKLSLRSRGDTDVGALARALGGGGHRLAAGATVVGESPEDLIEKVVSMVGEYR
ncbi:MAG TPA: bifunctional oligoribonuclease/PAP phosphatase NrnA [Acidimicrobiia bacterium]